MYEEQSNCSHYLYYTNLTFVDDLSTDKTTFDRPITERNFGINVMKPLDYVIRKYFFQYSTSNVTTYVMSSHSYTVYVT